MPGPSTDPEAEYFPGEQCGLGLMGKPLQLRAPLLGVGYAWPRPSSTSARTAARGGTGRGLGELGGSSELWASG